MTRASVCIGFLAALTAIPAAATTHIVTPQGTGDFATIQAAIDAALDGDIIELGSGTFFGEENRNLHFDGKAITVRSQDGDPEACTLHCDGHVGASRRAFRFDSGEQAGSIVRGITITGCYYRNGGAIECTNGSSPTISNCWFVEARARYRGGAVYCYGGTSPTMEGCMFIGNAAELNGGAVFCDANSSPTFIGCTFEDNEVTGGLASTGGALHLFGPGDAVVADCVFIGNQAYSGGALACASGARPRIRSCVFESNTSEASGGAVLCRQATPLFESCLFQYNHAGTYGGGMRIRLDADVAVAECVFYGNDADWNGGALYCDESDTHIASSTLAFNDAPSGGGIFKTDAGLTLESVIIAFSTTGHSIRWTCAGPAPVLSCCNFFGNAGGDWVGCGIEDQDGINGNVSADPLFCGPTDGSTPTVSSQASVFTLHADSPCLPGNHPHGDDCGVIGAFGPGCGVTIVRNIAKPMPLIEPASIETASWGLIKTIYK